MLLLEYRLNLRLEANRNQHFLFFLPLFFVLFQDKLYQEKQSDDGPGETVPDLEEQGEDGDKTKELLVRLRDLEVSPAFSWPNQLTWAYWAGG